MCRSQERPAAFSQSATSVRSRASRQFEEFQQPQCPDRRQQGAQVFFSLPPLRRGQFLLKQQPGVGDERADAALAYLHAAQADAVPVGREGCLRLSWRAPGKNDEPPGYIRSRMAYYPSRANHRRFSAKCFRTPCPSRSSPCASTAQPAARPPTAMPAASSTAWSAAFWWSRTSMAARPCLRARSPGSHRVTHTRRTPRQPGGLERLPRRRTLPRPAPAPRRARLLGFRGADRRTRHPLADRLRLEHRTREPAARAAGRTAPRRAPADPPALSGDSRLRRIAEAFAGQPRRSAAGGRMGTLGGPQQP